MYVKSVVSKRELYPDESNRIWLESRRKLSKDKRKYDYELVRLQRLIKSGGKENGEDILDTLDLTYLDPLTGVQGQEYFLRRRRYFQKEGVLIAIKDSSLEMVNEELGYQYGNLMVYTVAWLLNHYFSRVIRTLFCGKYFLVQYYNITLINTVQMSLNMASLRTSDGVEIRGIGIQVEKINGWRVKEINDPSCKFEWERKWWGEPVDIEISRIQRITETIKVCDIYMFGQHYRRLEGPLLSHLLQVGSK
jgi:hypothetical protein